MSTHNLCLKREKREKLYTPVNLSFTIKYYNIGVKEGLNYMGVSMLQNCMHVLYSNAIRIKSATT